MHQDRLSHLRTMMQAQDLDALALLPGPNLYYVNGLSFHLMERPIVGLFFPNAAPLMIVPEMELPKLDGSPLQVSSVSYGEDQASRRKAFEQAARAMNLNGMHIGVETTRMRFLELSLLQEAAPEAQFVSGEEVFANLRTIKSEQELNAMRRAVEIAEQALRATLRHIRVGASERELESELTIQLLHAGSEPDLPFRPIVASGPHSALPHATPGERRLQTGDLLILDWGARIEGYISDITRTFAVGDIDPELRAIYEITRKANAAGREAVQPGATCAEVDRATRSVIEAQGYGDAFLHRTGHGIGLEAHEAPYIRDENERLLAPGMTFTVEPGIYLSNRGGVRIEDNVAVVEAGRECLTTITRELVAVG
jgi:Xaa-Pro dipeptidase